MRVWLMCALLLTCSALRASDWIPAAHSKDGTVQVLVDASTIRIEGAVRRVWEKFVPARNTMKGEGESADKFVACELSHVAFNCSDETARTEATTIYFEDGETESLLPQVLRKAWEPIPPDSVLRFEMQFVCQWQAKRISVLRIPCAVFVVQTRLAVLLARG